MSESALTLIDLEKRFHEVRAVDSISLSVPEGAFLVLLGPSGCGKTTILRMLAGLEQPTAGEIRFGDTVVASGAGSLAPGQRDAGLVFQSYALWPHMTVNGNIEWPLKVAGWDAAKRRAKVEEVMKLLDISPLGERYPGEISGGQQQRVAIARMLAPGPNVLLFDEPLSNLDAKLRVDMRAELLRIHRATGATSVYVTHDQIEALTMATHIAVMNEGRIEQFGSPRELLASPASAFVATFIGTPPGNLVSVQVCNGRYRLGPVDLGPAASERSSHRLLYRPEQLLVLGEQSDRSLEVEFAEATPMAGRTVVTGWFEGERLSAVVDELPPLTLGDKIHFAFPERPAAVFDEEGRRLA